MKKSVFQKAVSLFLCAVLIAGVLPEMHLHSHAEEMAGTTELTEEQRQQVRNRTMESWYFPLPEEFYDDIMDYAGCRADQTNALDGTTNPGCIFPEHYDAPRGGESLYVNVATTQPVYAPARGYVYYAYDQHWGNVAVIENPVDASYSYYLVLGNVVPDGSIASGTYMDAGLAIGTVNGELRFTALMDASGKAEEIASDVEKALENLSWLLDSTGTGLVCVNPIDNAAHGGPIRYGFVPQQPAVEPTVPETTEPPVTEPPVTEPPVTEPPVTEPPVTEHQHDYVATVIRQPTHLTEGEVQYICACGDNYIEAIPKLQEHTFDQQVVSDAYLASAATPDSPAYYYYSCLCGEKGTETFAYGEPAGHTFSPEWTVNADYHWHADTCGHPDVTSDYGPHTWDAGVITVQPTHTATGTVVYTCTVCGAQKSETLPATTEHTFDQQVVSEAYLASAATPDSPARYYYSCICGEKGTETFAYGEAAGHTFSPEWSMDADHHWHADTCGHPDVTSDYGPHTWDAGVITVQPTHTSEGTKVYTCTVCGAQKSETLPASAEHVFDQQNTDAKYLKAAATCTSPAEYYYSCICGQVGTETFLYGEAKGHTFSDQWNCDENNHWHPATCEHTDEKGSFGPHRWDDGMITKNAGHNVDGEKVYTCVDCGYKKTEVIPGQPHEYNQKVVDNKYLKSPATCTTPATYYYSCVCGAAGTETFTDGEAKGHTFSDQWSHNEIQHWRAATCEHKDEKIQVGDHIWNPGVITTQPTATTKGVKTYTCSVCGATKTEEVAPSTHQHTFATTWQGNATYHWHPATCGDNNVSDLGEHRWNAGVVTSWPTHTTPGQKVYTCSVCGMTKTETLQQTHVYDQMNPTAANLKSQATCTSPAVYYKTCSCGAKGTETFTYGSALGHTASSTWGKDANYHWNVCSRCGAKGDLVAHTFGSDGKCTVCGYSKADAHVHTSHLTRVPAKAATCTTDGNTQYYICDCGQWFTDVTCNTPITDQKSVVLPATGHVDKDNNGRCDVCKARLDNVVEYQVTEGGDATWLNTSNQGMVFRSNAEYAKFDRLEVDGATVPATGYTVSEGSTVVELSATYLGRLSLGSHTLNIVSKDGSAKTTFTIKQGATSASSGGSIWGFVLIMTVIVAIAIPVTFGVMYYRKKVYGE